MTWENIAVIGVRESNLCDVSVRFPEWAITAFVHGPVPTAR
jgi:hypothetical protein